MQAFNIVLTLIALACAVWMGSKVIQHRNEITVSGQYFSAYRIFIMVCFAASAVTLFLGFKDIWDLLRSISITLMVGIFLCNREGAGENGMVYNMSLIPYEAISRYDYQRTKKVLEVYVVYREKVKDSVEESEVIIKFKGEDEQKILSYLESKMPKKHKRIKKTNK